LHKTKSETLVALYSFFLFCQLLQHNATMLMMPYGVFVFICQLVRLARTSGSLATVRVRIVLLIARQYSLVPSSVAVCPATIDIQTTTKH